MTQTPMVQLPMMQALWPRRATAQSTDLGRDALLVLAFSLVTALSAQIAVPLPFSPVPLTGQTFGVLLTGALLGPRLGALAMLLYLADGGLGLPFFAGGAAGPARLLGPTGGYLLSYPLAAWLTGSLAVRGWDRQPLTMLAAMLLGSLAIFALGAAQLSYFVGVHHAFWMGVLPFLPGDALKALLAAGLLPLGWKWIGRRI
jgi:biotin transport system substrate-specific component